MLTQLIYSGPGERDAMSWLKLAPLFVVSLIGAAVSADEPRLRDRIDGSLASAWQREKLTPAVPATDAEFLRRTSLDLVGSIPTHDEAVAFLDDVSPGKRDALIERLLADPRHAQHQADLWDLILFGRNPPGDDTDKREGVQDC
ncbi:MAG: DUF1549 domain-containing protein [Planctomycetaceae bacterium]|nr:DUF1549 domain-containing protein [Planctomycetaceae bacterium]